MVSRTSIRIISGVMLLSTTRRPRSASLGLYYPTHQTSGLYRRGKVKGGETAREAIYRIQKILSWISLPCWHQAQGQGAGESKRKDAALASGRETNFTGPYRRAWEGCEG